MKRTEEEIKLRRSRKTREITEEKKGGELLGAKHMEKKRKEKVKKENKCWGRKGAKVKWRVK